MSIRLPILAAALLAGTAATAQPMPAPAVMAPLVTISATGTIESAPDMATIGTGVQTQAATAAEATAANAARMERLLAALARAGVARKDIQTSSISLSPQYDYDTARNGGQPRFIGYQASNQLSVAVRTIGKTGALIDALVAAGATNINGPSFGLQDDAPVLDQARAQALLRARERALFYARQSGYANVRLVSISEGDEGPARPMPMMAMKAMDRETPVEAGQIDTSVSLTVRYALER
jgi:hypothetical protein